MKVEECRTYKINNGVMIHPSILELKGISRSDLDDDDTDTDKSDDYQDGDDDDSSDVEMTESPDTRYAEQTDVEMTNDPEPNEPKPQKPSPSFPMRPKRAAKELIQDTFVEFVEPGTYKQALRSPNAKNWIEAIESEMKSLQ
jgi:hypothetical protein